MAKTKRVNADESVAAALWSMKLMARDHTGDLLALVDSAPMYDSLDVASHDLIRALLTNEAGQFDRESDAAIRRLPRAARGKDGSAVVALWIDPEDTNVVHAELIAVARMALRGAQDCSVRARSIVRLLERALRRLEDAPRPPPGTSPGLQVLTESVSPEGLRVLGVPGSPMERWSIVAEIGQLGLSADKEEVELALSIVLGSKPELDTTDLAIVSRLEHGRATLAELATHIHLSPAATATRLRRLRRLSPPRVSRVGQGVYEVVR